MSTQRWSNLIARITPQEPDPIDDILSDLVTSPTKPGEAIAISSRAKASPMVEFEVEDQICFGARIEDDKRDTVALAMNLAQIAFQKNAEPVIFSTLDRSGLEKFGFRVERISGATPEEQKQAEEQLKAFWGVVMVV